MEKQQYTEQLRKIKGKTIGIVYIYENPDLPQKRHYDAWEGDVISNWVHAVYELRGLPLVMDVDTFVEKMANRSLPPMDYVVNLSNGYFDLPSLGLVPSLCSYHAIPCIPCGADLLLFGENKSLSNLVASSCGFQLPKKLDGESEGSITRPNSLGSSIGVYRGKVATIQAENSLIQEFVPGFDTTIPVLYNPLNESLSVLPAVAYVPENMNPYWFLGEQQKATHSEYEKRTVKIDESVRQMILRMVKEVGITTYCRLDFRTKCDSSEDMRSHLSSVITLDDLRFMEINPLPTIKDGINFFTALKAVDPLNSIAECLEQYQYGVREGSLTGFILSSSILAIKAKR